ncbi:MAG: hypothetical protein WAU13_13945 [Albidovulum sp.]
MSRHIIDRPVAPEGGRLKHYLHVEKAHGAEGSNPAVKALHERPVARRSVARMREFMRIEKGWTA